MVYLMHRGCRVYDGCAADRSLAGARQRLQSYRATGLQGYRATGTGLQGFMNLANQ
ncbi:hypothetical protein EMIT0196P_20391 [Pseudomonas chlororaphis]